MRLEKLTNIMKNLKFILILAISVMAISCGNDDDGGPAEPTLTPALLEGTYNLNFSVSEEVIEEVVTGGTATTTITKVGDTFGSSNIVFNANGTFTRNYQYRVETTTQFDDNETTSSQIITESNGGSYSVNDDDQTITIDGGTGDVTVFSSSQLRLEFMEVDVDGNRTTTTNTELRFERQ